MSGPAALLLATVVVVASAALGAITPITTAAVRSSAPGSTAGQGPAALGIRSLSRQPSTGLQAPLGTTSAQSGSQPYSVFASNNWDGYFAGGTGTVSFTAVSATWTVSPVTCSGTEKQWGAFWVGMDGWTNDVVEQGGTQAICRQGTPHYTVWWEMFPFNAIQKGYRVRPGDKITASVTYNPSTAIFAIVIKDRTNGKNLTVLTPCQTGMGGCPRTSAEVISEDISHFSSGRLFPLPDYSSQSYKKISITDAAGHTGTMIDSAWPLGQVTEVSREVIKQTTSDPNAAGNAFSTTWQNG